MLAGTSAAELLLTGCRPGTVRVNFRPPPGARYQYETEVRQVTVTRLSGRPEERSTEEATLRADDTVIDSGPDGVRMRVVLQRSGSPTRTFVVRFDRAAQLAGVETVEGLPAAVLGALSLPEDILPGAAGAPPNRPLAPGESWTIDSPLRLPGTQPTRLEGSGRLVELQVVGGGRQVASIQARTRLPLARSTELRDSRLSLDGVEVTDSVSTHAISDGAIEELRAVTRGDFALVLAPAGAGGAAGAGGGGQAVTGRLSIEVRSRTRRLH